MKLPPRIKVVLMTFALAVLLHTQTDTVHAQGPLTPPGAPAPTMKTLDQVEPRIPIGQADVPMTIANTGSYMLTGNLLNSIGSPITIEADNVTIDLNGFTISNQASCIEIGSGRSGIRIENGTIRGSIGAGASGVRGADADNVQLRGLRIADCATCVNLRDGARLIDCVIDTSTQSAVTIGNDGRLRDSVFYRAGLTALAVSDRAVIRDCTFIDNGGGVILAAKCVVADNLFRSNAGNQVFVLGSDNRIVGNQVLDGTSNGIRVLGTGNEISGNTVRGNADNYNFSAGNRLNLLLSEIPESIDWPASVKVAGTLTGIAGANGITVNASDVTIDLDGHALIGVPGSLTGIEAPASQQNVEIRNGILREWGSSGIDVSPTDNCVLLNLKAYTNGLGAAGSRNGLYGGNNARIEGCLSEGNGREGIFVGNSSTVDRCSGRNNGNSGILALTNSVIRGCTAESNGNLGIYLEQGVLADCSAGDNGNHGIAAGGDTVVTSCSAFGNDGDGISAGEAGGDGSLIVNCVASNNTSNGIRALDRSKVVDCTANGNSQDGINLRQYCVAQRSSTSENAGFGIGANGYCRVSECVAEQNTQDGFSVGSFSTVSECTATLNTRDGIRVGSTCRAVNNTCSQNGFSTGDGAGIHATGSDNRIDGNTVTDNDRGIHVAGSGSLVIRNSAADNSTNYEIAASNRYGRIIDLTAAGGAAVSGNGAASNLVTADPWANFSY